MIHTRQLRKQFTSRKETVDAVAGVDIDIDPGELVAFLGPNGAGKTTTLRMLTTLLPPTSGTAEVAGADIVRQPALVRSRIGYIGQGNGAGHQQRGRDELVSHGRSYGLSRTAARSRAAELVESLDLSAVADRKVSTLDFPVSPRGYRVLGRIPRLPKLVVQRIIHEFGGLEEVLAASDEDLEAVEGVGAGRAKDIREGLRRLQEVDPVDRYLQS